MSIGSRKAGGRRTFGVSLAVWLALFLVAMNGAVVQAEENDTEAGTTIYLPTVARAQPSGSIPDATGAVTDDAWLVSYWNNQALIGEPVVTGEDDEINYSWGESAPTSGVDADDFSARWTRRVDFEEGTYRFLATSDDGVRVFLDGNLIINEWNRQSARTFTVDRELAAGEHTLRVEYFEDYGDARVEFRWYEVDEAATDFWRGEYFNNRDLIGTPAFVREDEEIDFNWGGGSPGNGISDDDFSIRWTRTLDLDEGRYRFRTRTDDGVRLYIDGTLVISEWHIMSDERFAYDITFDDDGTHTVRMEYYEATGSARAELDIDEIDRNDDDDDNGGDDDANVQLVGNVVTCAPPNPPNNASIRVFRREGPAESREWVRITSKGLGAISATGYTKINGLPIDDEFRTDGHPYWVEIWQDGVILRSVGNTDRGEPSWRLFPDQDNYTPWQCDPSTWARLLAEKGLAPSE